MPKTLISYLICSVLFAALLASYSLGQSVVPTTISPTKDSSPVAKANGETADVDSPRKDKKDDLKRFEVGVHGTIMFQGDFNVAVPAFRETGVDYTPFIDERYESGIGGRFTFNITKNLAVESELNFTPSTPTINELLQAGITPIRRSSGGEKTQFLAGVKYGFRGKRIGVFGKARPGLIRFNAFESIDARFIVPSPTGGPPIDVLFAISEKPATFFNMDVGGVFEYYTSKRTMIRFDIGDTIIHYNAQKPRDVNPTFTRHNLQMNLGFGFRF